MRVEKAKNKEVERSESKLNKTEKSVFDSTNRLKSLDSSPPPGNGAFAKILEEARKDNRTNRNESHTEKQTEKELELTKPEKDLIRQKHEKLERERNQGKQNQSGDGNGENGSGTPFFNFTAKTNTEFSVPPARSILHIADLERIVSTIRTENFKTSQQVLISLKNSVLEGLEIKISLNENGKLKAQFLALNKQIKKQLESRKRELKEIFRSRSLDFAEIEVLTQTDK